MNFLTDFEQLQLYKKTLHLIGKVIKGVKIMNTNFNEKRILDIVEEFNNIKNFKLDMKNDIKSIKFYEQFNLNSKNVWVVEIEVDLMQFEGTNKIMLVVSDEKEVVEYWLDQNGIPQMF